MKTAFFVAVCVLWAGQAEAQQLLFDAAPTPSGSINNVCNGGVTVAIQAARPTTIGRIKQHIVAASATSVRFAIWSGSTHVFYSTPVAVAAGAQTVESPDFTFQLGIGIRYHIGAIVQGCADFSTDTSPATVVAIQSFATNGLPTNFGAPVGPNQSGSSDPRVLLFTPTTDVDGDGFVNSADNCAFDWQMDQADIDGDGHGDACDGVNNNDPDNDGIANTNDNCPFDSNANQADMDSDGIGDVCDGSNGLDLDADGISNTADNCPFDPNANQLDTDSDGIGDVCDPQQNGVNTDVDNDGVPNADDNCPFDTNSAQLDSDGDGLGNVCDSSDERDLDDDGVPNVDDNCPFLANATQADRDGDGIGDDCDEQNNLDIDDDTIDNLSDNCPFIPNATQTDEDGDGFGDACDDKAGDDTGCCGIGGSPGNAWLALLVFAAFRARHGARRRGMNTKARSNEGRGRRGRDQGGLARPWK